MFKKIKVIIVDDEARLRRGVERLVLVNPDEWEVIGSYSNGIECLNAVQEKEIYFDLLITDVKMPGIDGLTLIKRLKEITSFYSVVISGFDDFQFLQTAIREGASDYFIKPINRDEFHAQLNVIKDKIISRREANQYRKEVEARALQLVYVKQTQKLSEMTRKQEIDLSLLKWTEDFPTGSFQLLYVCIDNPINKTKSFQEKDWDVWKFAIDNISGELLDKLHDDLITSWRWKGENFSFWVLFHVQEPQLGEPLWKTSHRFAEEFLTNIRSYTPFTSSISISNRFHDLTLLPSLRDEQITNIQFRLLYGGNQLYSQDVIEKFQIKQKVIDSKKIENQIQKIIFSLDHTNKEEIQHEVEKFINSLKLLNSPTKIDQSLYLLGILVMNYMIKNSHSIYELPRIMEVFSLTKKIANIGELKQELIKWIYQLINYLEQKNKFQDLDHIKFAKKWIIEHLNENITIQKIASQVYMNPTYFCEYFKSQTGETVLDYVTRSRMEKAQDLLLTTNLKIYDISVNVGYTDTKYFSKLFKKQLGETPSKYRRKITRGQS